MNMNLHLIPGLMDDRLLYLGAEHRAINLFLNPQEGESCTMDFRRGDGSFWELIYDKHITLTVSIDDHLSSMAAVEENKHAHRFHAHAPFFEYYEPVREPSPRSTKQLKTHTCDHSFMNQNPIHESDPTSQPKAEALVPIKGTNDFTCSNLSSSHFDNQNFYVFSNDFQGGNDGANIKITKNTTGIIGPYYDHILAERKRRETLSQRFIALSALLPNLKKMDKASVLGDAIEYMKILKGRLKILEDQTSKQAIIESAKFEIATDEQLPEIKARFIGNDVLIRIHCVKKPGVVGKTFAEIEKLHLSVINSSAVIFANCKLHITVIAPVYVVM
ncbi:hypothetical protein R6Q57_029469 [Mikania cordata]